MRRDFDVDRLYAALDQQRQSLGLPWSGVAKDIERRYTKVAPSTIKGIRERRFIEGDGGLQLLLWLGRSPESFVPGLTADARHLLNQPQDGVLRFDVQHAFRLLDAKRTARGLSWGGVAAQIGGCSANMLKRFEKGGRTSFPAIMRVACWLDVPANELTRERPR